MQRQLAFKIFLILFLIILLLIPINMIAHLVYERMSLRNDVVKDIAKSSALSQQMTGPILVIPYTKTVYDVSDKKYYQKQGSLYFFPKTNNLTGTLSVEKRHRGIYEARVYNLESKLTSSFYIPKQFGIKDNIDGYQFGTPLLAIGISDTRGIGNQSKLIFNNRTLEIKPGTDNSKLGEGISAELSLEDLKQSEHFSYDISFSLLGTSNLNITPIAQETTIKISSDWPHPSFIGNFLPITRNVAKNGFNATWQTNLFATNIINKFNRCNSIYNCNEVFSQNSLGISLVEPVDNYSQTNRAIKYGILFIGLTFFGFFLFEMTKKLAIHPIQYGFVGISLALFFLLLLSLSEYIGFALAYLCSAIACISLISFYITSILDSKKQGALFTALLSLLYIMLYVLLNAEDYSLVMGSILVFVILSIAMMITRKLDWYKVATIPNKPFKNTSKEDNMGDYIS